MCASAAAVQCTCCKSGETAGVLAAPAASPTIYITTRPPPIHAPQVSNSHHHKPLLQAARITHTYVLDSLQAAKQFFQTSTSSTCCLALPAARPVWEHRARHTTMASMRTVDNCPDKVRELGAVRSAAAATATDSPSAACAPRAARCARCARVLPPSASALHIIIIATTLCSTPHHNRRARRPTMSTCPRATRWRRASLWRSARCEFDLSFDLLQAGRPAACARAAAAVDGLMQRWMGSCSGCVQR